MKALFFIIKSINLTYDLLEFLFLLAKFFFDGAVLFLGSKLGEIVCSFHNGWLLFYNRKAQR